MIPANPHPAGPWPRRLPLAPVRRALLGLLVFLPACSGLRPAFDPLPAGAAPPADVAAASRPAADAPLPASTGTSADDIARAAASVFGDSAATGTVDAVIEEPVWDIDVRSYETHDRVAHYVELFSTRARERFEARLSRGTRYEPMIRAKLRANGMPEDLTYLALIESGYDPHAYSRAAAVGMWQFMSSTARDVGMRVDWWMDERRDPARATDGAIRFLGYLQRQFGSLYLAAAAYNGGPGRVSRGLTRFAEELEGAEGEDRFFALAEQDYLRAETKNYVPQLIAAALVAKMPARYGLRIDSLPEYRYDSVRVAAGTSLAAVALAGGVATDSVRELNPAILRGVSPPDAEVWVRVPTGTSETIRLALDSMPSEEVRGYRTVNVTKATTPAALAKSHGVTVKQLRWFNPTWRTTGKGNLVAGQVVRVPHGAALAVARDIPDPSIERYGGAAGSRSLASRGVHVVRRGETLGGIARRYGLTESQLRALNGIRGTRILAGQTLEVRRTAVATAAAGGAKASASGKTAAKSTATKATAKKATTKKATTKKASATKSTAKKSTAKTATAKGAPTKKAAAKSATTKKATS